MMWIHLETLPSKTTLFSGFTGPNPRILNATTPEVDSARPWMKINQKCLELPHEIHEAFGELRLMKKIAQEISIVSSKSTAQKCKI